MSDLLTRLARLDPAVRESVVAGLLARRAAAGASGPPSPPPLIRHIERTAQPPLSLAQERLWFLDRFQPESPFYNVATAIHIRGALDLAFLRRALESSIARHEGLRTVFPEAAGRPYQRILESSRWDLPLIDLSNLDPEVRADRYRQLELAEARTPFNLSTGPLLRTTVARLAGDHHVLVVVMHHIISDGWSMGIIVRELNEYYQAARDGRSPEMSPLPVQYVDYALWQREWVDSAAIDAQLQFWCEHLRGVPPLMLPADRQRPAVMRYQGADHHFTIRAGPTAAAREFCRNEGTTPFMLLLGVFEVWLARLSDQTDLCVGVPIANRGKPELETLVGFFVNTLALRASLSDQPTLRQHLQRVRETALAAYAHQDAPFERVVDSLGLPRDLSRTPVFQAMFAFQNAPSSQVALGDTTVEADAIDTGTAKFDLLLSVQERGENFFCSLQYATDLFDASSARHFSERFQALLASALAAPDESVLALPWIPADEAALLEQLRSSPTESFPDDDVLRMFDAQVRATPTRAAVEHDEWTCTYDELDTRSRELAARLQLLGAGPGTRVGVLIHRSPDLIVAVLAVLRAGSAYVPLDPSYPDERLQLILKDAGVAICLMGADLAARPLTVTGGLIAQRGSWREFGTRTDAGGTAAQADLAYVMYTSGSTGQPKGVAMGHRALANLIQWQQRDLAAGGAVVPARTLQFASIGFDVSFQEIFSTLATGGTLVLIGEDVRRDPFELLKLLAEKSVERVFLPYVVLSQLADAAIEDRAGDLALREVITAGEQLRITPSIRRLFAQQPAATLHNHYGPTETHVVTAHRLSGAPEIWPALPPIGRPIANARAYVLDARGEPAALGTAGELWIGGAPVAQGYWGRPSLTQERFVPDRFVDQPEAVMYRTGDRVRWNSRHELEYLGRGDRQAKIRGHRVELGEVEAVVGGHPEVAACAVEVRANATGSQELVAYVVPSDGASLRRDDMAAFVKRLLPDPMVPSSWHFLSALPLSTNGKVSRSTLPEPAVAADDADTITRGEEPRTELERELCALFEEVLNAGAVGIDHNFFDLGGNSMSAVALVSAIRRQWSRQVPVATIFSTPTVRLLAEAIAHLPEPSPLVVLKAGDDRPPLICLHPAGGHVFCYRELARFVEPGRACYGVQVTSLAGPSSIDALARHYANVLKGSAVQRCHLLGWSFGGLIAAQMASLLEETDTEVASLLLLDSVSTDIIAAERDVRRDSDTRDRWLAASSVEWPASTAAEDRAQLMALFASNVDAMLRHASAPVRVPAMLITAADNTGTMSELAARAPAYGWDLRVAPQIAVQATPGNHYTMMEAPEAAALAALVDDFIARHDHVT